MNNTYNFAIITLKWQLADSMISGHTAHAQSCLEAIKLLQLYSTFDTAPVEIENDAGRQNARNH